MNALIIPYFPFIFSNLLTEPCLSCAHIHSHLQPDHPLTFNFHTVTVRRRAGAGLPKAPCKWGPRALCPWCTRKHEACRGRVVARGPQQLVEPESETQVENADHLRSDAVLKGTSSVSPQISPESGHSYPLLYQFGAGLQGACCRLCLILTRVWKALSSRCRWMEKGPPSQ